jgi:hypothetical protein
MTHKAFFTRGNFQATRQILEYLVNHFLYLVLERHKRRYFQATRILPVSRDLQGRSPVVCVSRILQVFSSVFLFEFKQKFLNFELFEFKQQWPNTLLTSSLWVKLKKGQNFIITLCLNISRKNVAEKGWMEIGKEMNLPGKKKLNVI